METLHKSDCAVHNEPAYPNGPCDCGGIICHTKQMFVEVEHLAESLINVECEVRYTDESIVSVTYMGDNVTDLVDLGGLLKEIQAGS